MKWLVFGWVLNFAQAGPLDLEQEYIRRLNHATSIREIESLQATFEKMRVARLACRMQISSALVPSSCFEALRLEQRWGLRTQSVTAKLELDLNERCRKSAQGLRLPTFDFDLNDLSKVCRQEVEEARAIQAYRARNSDVWSVN